MTVGVLIKFAASKLRKQLNSQRGDESAKSRGALGRAMLALPNPRPGPLIQIKLDRDLMAYSNDG